jgi:hypothetical protein
MRLTPRFPRKVAWNDSSSDTNERLMSRRSPSIKSPTTSQGRRVPMRSRNEFNSSGVRVMLLYLGRTASERQRAIFAAGVAHARRRRGNDGGDRRVGSGAEHQGASGINPLGAIALNRHHPSCATCIRVDGADRRDPHADFVGRTGFRPARRRRAR